MREATLHSTHTVAGSQYLPELPMKEGQKIAEVGETGVASGPHLHFELQKNGTYLNPIYYVD